MESPDLNNFPGGPFGALGALSTAVVSGFLFLRQYLSRGAADRADDAGRVSAINVYKELLEAERAARASLTESPIISISAGATPSWPAIPARIPIPRAM